MSLDGAVAAAGFAGEYYIYIYKCQCLSIYRYTYIYIYIHIHASRDIDRLMYITRQAAWAPTALLLQPASRVNIINIYKCQCLSRYIYIHIYIHIYIYVYIYMHIEISID